MRLISKTLKRAAHTQDVMQDVHVEPVRRAAFGMRDAEAPQPHHLILDSHW